MLNRDPEPMSIEAFFAWQGRQSERCELVASLHTALRGSGYRPFTGDGSVETLPGQSRRPDADVDGGARDPNAMEAAKPKLVAEILSPSTRDFDAFEKLGEYKVVESLDHILLIEPNAAEIMHGAPEPDRSWRKQRIAALDRASLGIPLALSEIYDGVDFPARPRLQDEGPDEARR